VSPAETAETEKQTTVSGGDTNKPSKLSRSKEQQEGQQQQRKNNTPTGSGLYRMTVTVRTGLSGGASGM
jgi:CRISPR/Cas system-associated protein Cas7 (RAMP superfamily)